MALPKDRKFNKEVSLKLSRYSYEKLIVVWFLVCIITHFYGGFVRFIVNVRLSINGYIYAYLHFLFKFQGKVHRG